MAGFRGLISKTLSAISGAIERARSGGASAIDIQDEVIGTVPGATVEQIGYLISATDAIANAIDEVYNASAYDAVNVDMIAVPAWAPQGTTPGGGGPYQIRIPFTNPDAAPGEISGWITQSVDFLPATVGDLMAMAQDAVDVSTSPKPGATLTDGVHILAV